MKYTILMSEAENQSTGEFVASRKMLEKEPWLAGKTAQLLLRKRLLPVSVYEGLNILKRDGRESLDTFRRYMIEELADLCAEGTERTVQFLVDNEILNSVSLRHILDFERGSRSVSRVYLSSFFEDDQCDVLAYLHMKGILTADTLAKIYFEGGEGIYRTNIAHWQVWDDKGIVGNSWNEKTGPFKEIVDWEYFLGIMTDQKRISPQGYKDAHPLLLQSAAQEEVTALSEELRRLERMKIIDPTKALDEQFQQVMAWALSQTEQWKLLMARGPIENSERERNISLVRRYQADFMKEPNEGDGWSLGYYLRRRPNAENMDRFVARCDVFAISQFIRSGYSLLATDIKIVPREISIEARSRLIEAIDPGTIAFLPVTNDAFRYLKGVTLICPTHGSYESMQYSGAVSVLGTAILVNKDKREHFGAHPYVALNRDHDKIDSLRREDSDVIARNARETADRLAAGKSVISIVNEMLRAVVEVENLQIKIAQVWFSTKGEEGITEEK